MSCYHPVESAIYYGTDRKIDEKHLVIFDWRNNKWFNDFIFRSTFGKSIAGLSDDDVLRYCGFTPTILPCGRCVGCLLRRSLEWSCRVCAEQFTRHHFHNSPFASFLTLTYNNQNLPEDHSIRVEEVQGFMKRLREFYDRVYGIQNLKFFACGEYGENFHRPHYHIVILGTDFCEPERLKQQHTTDAHLQLDRLDSIDPDLTRAPIKRGPQLYETRALNKLWKKGYIVAGTCTAQSVAYTARYSTKKLLVQYKKVDRNTIEIERDGQNKKVRSEFIRMSKGFGEEYLDRYYPEIYENNRVSFGNDKFIIPRYFDKKMQSKHPEDWLKIANARQEYLESEAFLKEQDPDRLRQKEEIKMLNLKFKLLRSYEQSGDFMAPVEQSIKY